MFAFIFGTRVSRSSQIVLTRIQVFLQLYAACWKCVVFSRKSDVIEHHSVLPYVVRYPRASYTCIQFTIYIVQLPYNISDVDIRQWSRCGAIFVVVSRPCTLAGRWWSFLARPGRRCGNTPCTTAGNIQDRWPARRSKMYKNAITIILQDFILRRRAISEYQLWTYNSIWKIFLDK